MAKKTEDFIVRNAGKQMVEAAIGPDELEEKKNRLCKVDVELIQIESQKAKANRAFNEQLEPLKEERKELAAAIELERAEVEVECLFRIYREAKKVEVVRKDTGAIIETRPASASDLQEDLFDDSDLPPVPELTSVKKRSGGTARKAPGAAKFEGLAE